MKILRIIYDWPPPWSGLAPHPYEVTVSQAKKGHQIEVMCARWPNAGPLEQPRGVKVTTVWREPFPGAVFFTSSIQLFFNYLAWRKKNTCDVIHAHGHFAIWLYLYRAILKKLFPWAKELKTPLVVHFHNTPAGRAASLEEKEKPIKPHSKFFVWPLENFSARLAAYCASACIFVSEATKAEAFTYYNIDPDKCFVVETGVNTDVFKPAGSDEKEKSRRELDLDLFDKLILYHGVVLDRKNVHVLVEALKFLPPHYKLLISGDGDAAYLQKIAELIKATHLEDRVINTGYTPYPEVPIAYQMSDVFVLPSAWEGLPKVVMQGLACGVPCLVSGFKLSEAISGLAYLENTEPEYIAKEIQKIVENPGHVDVALINYRYSWDKRVAEIEKVYDYAKENYI